MDKKETGGPAYPTHNGMNTGTGHPMLSKGMTLRDYFAGQALAGLSTATNSDGDWMGDSMSGIAHEAYEIADAMLKERNK